MLLRRRVRERTLGVGLGIVGWTIRTFDMHIHEESWMFLPVASDIDSFRGVNVWHPASKRAASFEISGVIARRNCEFEINLDLCLGFSMDHEECYD